MQEPVPGGIKPCQEIIVHEAAEGWGLGGREWTDPPLAALFALSENAAVLQWRTGPLFPPK